MPQQTASTYGTQPWPRLKAIPDCLSSVLTDPKHCKWICPSIFLMESILCSLIIRFIPYTEIDWTTYMQQVSQFLQGERDYANIEGDTGPLVYPAGHVYAYSLFYILTDQGRDIRLGQILFEGIYLLTLAVVMCCYQSVRAPPYLFMLLPLSKRLHSLFLLRLFNDGIATLLLWSSLFVLQQGKWTAAVVFWSLGLGVKMTLLLLAPAMGIIAILVTNLAGAVRLGIVALSVQILLALPFLKADPVHYMSHAFEFGRKFLYKWTVNWRFIGEETFSSLGFSVSLLSLHAILLLAFLAFKWVRPTRLNLWQFIKLNLRGGKSRSLLITRSFVTASYLSSLMVGLLCARSLHYQFFAYLSWATPLALWLADVNPALIFTVYFVQEWSWNVFPSTFMSSVTAVTCLSFQVLTLLSNKWRTASEASIHREKEA